MPYYNPHTRREIRYDGPTYKQLLKEGYTDKQLQSQLEIVEDPKSGSKRKEVECKDLSRLKKYNSRKGPPYPANSCRFDVKIGNDGIEYESKPSKNGVFRWVKRISVPKKIKK